MNREQARALLQRALGEGSDADFRDGQWEAIDALVNENERLQARINQLLDKIEASLKQALRVAATQEQLSANADFGGLANVLLCYVIGRWQQYAKSGFTREPAALWAQQWPMLYITCLSQRSA